MLKLKISILAVVVFTTALFFNITTVYATEKTLTIIAGDKKYEFFSYEIGSYNGNYFLKNSIKKTKLPTTRKGVFHIL
jgi:hypothetical protein